MEEKTVFSSPRDIDMWLASMTVIIFVNNTKRSSVLLCRGNGEGGSGYQLPAALNGPCNVLMSVYICSYNL